MSCYHPLIAFPSGEKNPVTGKLKYIVKKQIDSKGVEDELRINKDAIIVPCGKCIGCRLDYSRRWADRMMLELETMKKAVFITLTYDEEHVHRKYADDGTSHSNLDKRDAQLWLKRLRKEFYGYRLRFYLCGEYGSKTERSHMHCILFGLSLNDIGDCVLIGLNRFGDKYFTSDRIKKTWQNKGHVMVTDVSWKTCAYVARYCTKKLGDSKGIDYDKYDLQKEFSLMSRKPGIGAEYLINNPDSLDYVNIPLSTPEGGHEVMIPKYYLQKLNQYSCDGKINPLYDPEKYAIMCEERKKFASERMMLKLQLTDKGILEYLDTEEENYKSRVNAVLLTREKV